MRATSSGVPSNQNNDIVRSLFLFAGHRPREAGLPPSGGAGTLPSANHTNSAKKSTHRDAPLPLEKLLRSESSSDMDAVFTCAVCLDYYKTPKNLPNCGHCYCLSCLQSILLADTAADPFATTPKIICPDCRSINLLGPGGVHELKTNIQLQRGVEFLKLQQVMADVPTSSEQSSSSSPDSVPSLGDKCPHKNAQSSIICQHCNNKFCSKCQVSHMELMKIEIIAQKDLLQKKVETTIEGSQEKVAAVERVIGDNVHDVELKIKEARDALESAVRTAINAKCDAFFDQLGSIRSKQMAKVIDVVNAVGNKREKDAELCVAMEKLSTKSVIHCQLNEIADLHKDLYSRNEEVALLESLKTSTTDSLAGKISFRFDQQLEQAILAQFVELNFGSVSHEA